MDGSFPSDDLKPHYLSLTTRPVSDEAKRLAKRLAAAVGELEKSSGDRKRGRDKKLESLQLAAGALLAELMLAQGDLKAEGWVYRPMNTAGFSGEDVSYRIFKPVMKGFAKLGWIERVPGKAWYTRNLFAEEGEVVPPTKTGGKATHLRATQVLLDLASEHGITPESVGRHFAESLPKHPLVLKSASRRNHRREKISGDPMDFNPTAKTRELEDELRHLNRFLDQFQLEGGIHCGFVRVFNEGDQANFDWNKGGRLYSVTRQPGGSYQRLPSEKRLEMLIDGEPVVEIDIRASYLTVLYGFFMEKLEIAPPVIRKAEKIDDFDPENDDPYALEGIDRDAAKTWTVVALGSEAFPKTWSKKVIEDFQERHGRDLSQLHQPEEIQAAMLRKHPILHHYFIHDREGDRMISWGDLMFRESQAVLRTMLELMREGIPSYTVHDSLIVRERDAQTAQECLKRHYEMSCGITPALRSKRSPERKREGSCLEMEARSNPETSEKPGVDALDL